MNSLKYKTHFSGAVYHIYNRGNEKRRIFIKESDYQYYIDKLEKALAKYHVSLISYCLMPNHVHLIVKQNSEDPIFRLISSLHTSYSMYFNNKYDRVGHLFQGRYRQKIISDSEGLLYLTCYVHLNPLTAGIVKELTLYKWSSFSEYAGIGDKVICDK